MIRSGLLVLIAAVVSSCPLGCAHSAPDPVAPSHGSEVTETFGNAFDQDVPLIAPDEESSSKPNPKLTAPKSIGGDGEAYDLGKPGRDAVRPTTGRSNAFANNGTTLRTRGYVRGASANTNNATYGRTGGATNATNASGAPAVGGSFPAPQSFGSAAAR
jgi:hypothetical protein